MAQDRRRGGQLMIAGGLLLAAASLIVMVAVPPDADDAAGAIRFGAVFTFITGALVGVSGALHRLSGPRRPPIWRSRGYGVLLLAAGSMLTLAGLMREPDPDWLGTAGGTSVVAAGAAIVLAARRRASAEGAS